MTIDVHSTTHVGGRGSGVGRARGAFGTFRLSLSSLATAGTGAASDLSQCLDVILFFVSGINTMMTISPMYIYMGADWTATIRVPHMCSTRETRAFRSALRFPRNSATLIFLWISHVPRA